MANLESGSVPHKKPKFLRRRYIIYPQFQYAIMAANIVLLLCTFMIVFIQLQLNFENLLNLGLDIKLSSDHIFFRFIEFHQKTLLQSLALAALISMIFSIIVTIMLSHRLAGPIIRLREHLRRYAETGRYEELSFRKNDFFLDMPEIVNKALKTNQQKKQEESSDNLE